MKVIICTRVLFLIVSELTQPFAASFHSGESRFIFIFLFHPGLIIICFDSYHELLASAVLKATASFMTLPGLYRSKARKLLLLMSNTSVVFGPLTYSTPNLLPASL